MDSPSPRQLFVCTITRLGALYDLKVYLADYAEQALQRFMSPRRRSHMLESRWLPTCLGTPIVCEKDHFKSINGDYEIEAAPARSVYRRILQAAADELEREVVDVEQSGEKGAADSLRKLERWVFREIWDMKNI